MGNFFFSKVENQKVTKNSWNFVDILATQHRTLFIFTYFFDRKSQNFSSFFQRMYNFSVEKAPKTPTPSITIIRHSQVFINLSWYYFLKTWCSIQHQWRPFVFDSNFSNPLRSHIKLFVISQQFNGFRSGCDYSVKSRMKYVH